MDVLAHLHDALVAGCRRIVVGVVARIRDPSSTSEAFGSVSEWALDDSVGLVGPGVSRGDVHKHLPGGVALCGTLCLRSGCLGMGRPRPEQAAVRSRTVDIGNHRPRVIATLLHAHDLRGVPTTAGCAFHEELRGLRPLVHQ